MRIVSGAWLNEVISLLKRNERELSQKLRTSDKRTNYNGSDFIARAYESNSMSDLLSISCFLAPSFLRAQVGPL